LVDNDLGYRLYQAIEQTKCKLSDSKVSQFNFSEAGVAIAESVSREAFEEWIGTELRQISECIDRLLSHCHVVSNDVEAIFMTGGSSFVPAIRRIFETKLGAKVPLRIGQEFNSVAEGLAIYAAELLR
jgi:hypothetical chaperone protein